MKSYVVSSGDIPGTTDSSRRNQPRPFERVSYPSMELICLTLAAVMLVGVGLWWRCSLLPPVTASTWS